MFEPPRSNDAELITNPASSIYRRFKIETSEAPPRHKQPRPFTPRVGKVGLARTIAHHMFEYGFRLKEKKYRQVLLTRPCIYGVFSSRFGGFHPIKDRCTACMRCVQEYPQFCRVDRNPEYFSFADSYWVPPGPTTARSSPVATVSYEAMTGKIPIRGMGYKEAFAGAGWDSIWTDMSEIVRPTRDGVYGREYISTLTDLGRKSGHMVFPNPRLDSRRRIELELPIIFDYLPGNLNNQSITRSIASSARRAGTIFIASPEQLVNLAGTDSTSLMSLISPGEVAANLGVISESSAVEFTSYDSDALTRVRESNPGAPVSVRLPATKDAEELATDLAKSGVDVIHLFANYHGEGWDSQDQSLLKDYIRSVHRRLVKERLRDEVTLIASGGITLAEHVPKAIACGADLVALDITALVALQVQFQGECRTPDEGTIKPERFDSGWGEKRLVNLMASWHDQLIEVLSAMGMRDVRRLRGDVGRIMFNEDLEKEAFADIINRS